MASMTIMDAAEHLGISKEAIHNRVRRGSMEVTVIDGVKYVNVDATLNTASSTKTKKAPVRRTSTKAAEDRYYKLLEEQNAQLQNKVEKLEGETRTLRDQKEEMLIQERIKIEQIYKDKDEQLKNLLNTISSQFMIQAPVVKQEEEHLDAEIEEVEELVEVQEDEKGKLISLKKYLRNYKYSEKKQEKIKARFTKKSKNDDRIIVLGKKVYIDILKYDYSDLIR
ncbi:MAG: DNA repair exonuclease SbcCD ATPase subunit [Sulfurimonas sp.]|jgi:DNA repair exonuclease SbcCD ATPase subunit|uniref:DNA-binding protein n=1 Tax=Sulfurimonas sp. TaxID=2022749 RepID=UPI0039E4E379